MLAGRLGFSKSVTHLRLLTRSIAAQHRSTGPFPFFFFFGGGAQHFLPEFLIFSRKVEHVWTMHFFLTWGGGGGR